MKRTTQRRGCLIAAGVVVSLALALAGFLAVMGQICSPPWPKRAAVRLEPARPRLTAEAVTADNGFYYLRQLLQYQDDLERLREPVPQPKTAENEMAAMFPAPTPAPMGFSTPLWDEEMAFSRGGYQRGAYPEYERLLARAEPALKLCAQAAACPKAQVTTLDRFDYDLPYLGPLNAAVRLLSFRLEKRGTEGNWPGVTEDARTALVCARQVACGGGVANHEASYRSIRQVCTSVRRITLSREVPPETTRALIGLLVETEAGLEPFAEGLRVERIAGLHLVAIAVGKEKGFDKDVERIAPYTRPLLWLMGSTDAQMKRHATDCYSLLIHDAEQPYRRSPAGWMEIVGFINGSRSRFPFGLLGSDPMGRVVVALLMPGMAQPRAREATARAVLRGTAAVLAIQGWRQQHGGRTPEQLDLLVSEWLPEAPADPCAVDPRTPLRYQPDGQGWRLYSVGPDQENDGGVPGFLKPREGHRWAEQVDICFHSDEFVPVSEDRDGGALPPPR